MQEEEKSRGLDTFETTGQETFFVLILYFIINFIIFYSDFGIIYKPVSGLDTGFPTIQLTAAYNSL